MALYFIDREVQTQNPNPGGFTWDQWYAQNKERLSEKRAKRYREDPEYRKAALERSRKQRIGKKVSADDGFGISFQQAAEKLDITIWVLREWRRKDYFPEPHHREGRLWFNGDQVSLLRRLKEFFETHGIRVVDTKRKALDETVSLVYSNW